MCIAVLSAPFSREMQSYPRLVLGLSRSRRRTLTRGARPSDGTLNVNNASALGTGPLSLSYGNLGNTSGAPIALSTNNAQGWGGNFSFVGPFDLDLGTGPVTIKAGEDLTVFTGNLTVGGAISGNGDLRLWGSGTLTLAGTNTYAGPTTICGGTLLAKTPASLPAFAVPGTVAVIGGTLAVSVGGPNGWAASDVTALLANATFSSGSAFGIDTTSADGGNFTFSNVVGGDIALKKLGNGALTLSGANTFTGETKINAGAILLDNPNALQNSTLNYDNLGGVLGFGTLDRATLGGLKGAQALPLTNANGDPLALTVGQNNESTTYSGQLSGGGSLAKVGIGSLTLNGTNNYAGGTAVNAGTLQARARPPCRNTARPARSLSTTAVHWPSTPAGQVSGPPRTSAPFWQTSRSTLVPPWASTPPAPLVALSLTETRLAGVWESPNSARTR